MHKIFLFIFFLLLFLACQSNRNVRNWLDKAEDVMYRHSDSTLLYLNKISKPETLADTLWARYQYIHMTVSARRNMPEASDSVLLKAASIFQMAGDSLHTVQALFQVSLISLYKGDYNTADSILSLALPYAPDRKELMFLQNYKGFNAFNRGKPEEAVQWFQKNLKDTTDISPLNQIHYLGNLAQAYRYSGEKDSAFIYLRQAIRNSIKYNYTQLTIFYAGLLSETYKESGNLPESIRALKQAVNLERSREGIAVSQYTHGLLYIAQGKIDSAKVYLQYAIQNTDTYIATLAYEQLSLLYEKEGNNNLAYSSWFNYLQSLRNATEKTGGIVVRKKYQDEKLRNELNELKLKKNAQDIFLLLLCLAVVILCALGYVIYVRERKKKLKREQQIKEEYLQSQVTRLEQERELIILRERATALREQLFRRLSASQKIPSLAGSKTDKSGEEEKSRLTPQEIEEIVGTVNDIWQGFASRLQNDYPQLRPKDISFCCLIKADIKTKDLASIYYVTPSAISQKKARMKKEKFGLMDETPTLDDFLDKY